MSYFSHMLNHLLDVYGYVILGLSLLFEMLALPLPGELIMTYAGLIVYEGKLNWLLCVFVGGAGASLGMTASYWIGFRFGNPFFEKYGARFHLGPDKLNRLSAWFDRYGNKLLLIAYFIPGVRHMTGYFSGTTRLPFRKYAAFAYSGAFLWVFVFVTLGKLLGPKWEQYHHTISLCLIIAGVIGVSAYLLYVWIKRKRQAIYDRLLAFIEAGRRRYRSLGKIKLIILAASAAFVALFSVMVGLIQDFMAHEFAEFDGMASFLIDRIFAADWSEPMTRYAALGSWPALAVPALLTLLWIGFKGKNRLLECAFYIAVVMGGEGLDEGLRQLFHRIGPAGNLLTFPSEQVFMALTVYGFSAYIVVRHHGKHWQRLLLGIAAAMLCLLVGVSMIDLGLNYPSDTAAGCVFGGMWMTLNIALMESFRMMGRNALWPRAQIDG